VGRWPVAGLGGDVLLTLDDLLIEDGKIAPFSPGQTVDILFDITNPGLWMAHCHIAEHMQSGMMFSFTVARRSADE
jgi:FtsP/CotA-like multicopper oxidase with cupredoxin domain